MRYVAAYLLAVLGGNSSPTVSDIKEILESSGIGFDQERATTVCEKFAGKDINELIAEGAAKMSSMPSGAASASNAGGAASGGDAAAAEETKEEEKKKDESEDESDDDMGFGL